MVELGHGPPTIFLTLSCAEVHWKDVKRLLQDRMSFIRPADRIPLESKQDITRAVNKYSLVIQEFFIAKVKNLICHYAKDALGITHYFGRFEFAKGRGEIHEHLLCVANNKNVIKRAF